MSRCERLTCPFFGRFQEANGITCQEIMREYCIRPRRHERNEGQWVTVVPDDGHSQNAHTFGCLLTDTKSSLSTCHLAARET